MLSSQGKVNILKDLAGADIENAKSTYNLNKVKKIIDELLMDGLQHGFFEYKVRCEITKDNKRLLFIEAGKSHKFYIPEEEIIT